GACRRLSGSPLRRLRRHLPLRGRILLISPPMSPFAVTLDDIETATARLAGVAGETPLIESPAPNGQLGARVLIKPETLQRVGAFKFRGAYNRLVQLAPEERRRGVVAFSSGNHAQGVALAARLLGVPALIVMPADAPAVKVQATL